MQRKFLHWQRAGLLLMLALSLVAMRVDAQGDTSRVIYTGGDLRATYWSTDSERIVFVPDYGPSTTTTSKSILYDIQSQTSDERAEWGLQPELTPTEETTFAPGDNFMFVSPDGNLIAYVKPITLADSSGRLSIASRNTGTVVTTNLSISDGASVNVFFILWSADSTSFVVNRHLGSDRSPVYHVANANTSNPTVTRLSALTINGESYPWHFLVLLYDISDDGSTVLLRMIELDPLATDSYEQNARLVLWIPNNPSNTRVIPTIDAKQVADAAFIGNSSENLVLLDDNGLSTYTLQTNAYRTITTEFNSNGYDYFSSFGPYKRVYFSPNVKWLVILEPRIPRSGIEVTLIDLAGYNFDS